MSEETQEFVKNVMKQDKDKARKNLVKILKEKIINKIREKWIENEIIIFSVNIFTYQVKDLVSVLKILWIIL